MLTLLTCFATGTPMTVQEKIATTALFMTMLGAILYASVYRGRGDDPPDDDSGHPPDDDPGGDHAYPWWPEFERKLRDYERERGRERPKTMA